MNEPLMKSFIPGHTPRRGKVRDIFPFGKRLLLVSTDRISANDMVFPNGVPDKGRVLNGISVFWFSLLKTVNHLLEADVQAMPLPGGTDLTALDGRVMLVRNTSVVPIECVVRGYLSGSGWKEYRKSDTVCGIKLPGGLRESDRLPEPIFTPATKEDNGHDINISFEQMAAAVGQELAEELRRRSLAIYQRGAEHALQKGIIIADTKFEWGQADGELLLIDEVLTPDSSRFWPADQYEPGRGQVSLDKQRVRDWLAASGWTESGGQPMPPLPSDVVVATRAAYIEIYEILTGNVFPWK